MKDIDRLMRAKENITKAKDELVLAVMSLDLPGDDSFRFTIENIKEVIGDLVVTEKIIETYYSV